ncbi:PspC family transcriptional regulator [Rhodonellum psychrophilum GCM71 = DSM 17998]|uniref:PspC family transcriptional regulator n=2 Tax=Rhodonellum TaxID=336827 RepID=U5C389_9BACT|nr:MULTISPECIES: PspC family transcriptional regulator [Rhodonellum]ERM83366.1 PspC family transcriptional regulator [Rhodonellum psychrophilum GCM71 = DSM 17998]MDO9551167.1 PspC family transcriptional regulator [Rhodonellum sp.]SDZ38313.1 phage shock protein C (PspC) family protein [Rhodonellum ikkaensis]
MNKLKHFFEERAFGVCSKLGEKFHFPIDSIRLFFIYSSFITMGSPVIVYVSMAMMMKIRKYLRKMNNPVLFD